MIADAHRDRSAGAGLRRAARSRVGGWIPGMSPAMTGEETNGERA